MEATMRLCRCLLRAGMCTRNRRCPDRLQVARVIRALCGAPSSLTMRPLLFRLLKRQISLEFDGRTDLDLRPEGLVCTIVLTLPNLPVPLNLEGARDSE